MVLKQFRKAVKLSNTATIAQKFAGSVETITPEQERGRQCKPLNRQSNFEFLESNQGNTNEAFAIPHKELVKSAMTKKD
jgi:hypothetical protein